MRVMKDVKLHEREASKICNEDDSITVYSRISCAEYKKRSEETDEIYYR